MVEVYACQLMPEEEFVTDKTKILDYLEPGLRHKIEKFVREDDAQRSLLGELLVRYLIHKNHKIPCNEIRIAYSNKGKPFLMDREDVRFNVSHSGNWVVVALSDRRVGIDIEEIKPAKIKIAKRFFTDSEYSDLVSREKSDQPGYFFELWTCKESYLKALGKGLTKSLGSFSVRKGNRQMEMLMDDQNEKVYFRQYDIDINYKLSVCSFEDNFSSKVEKIEYTEMIKNLKFKI
jgi:4'-phosphopantetheinyl transferase